jgi:hypothetical protein
LWELILVTQELDTDLGSGFTGGGQTVGCPDMFRMWEIPSESITWSLPRRFYYTDEKHIPY